MNIEKHGPGSIGIIRYLYGTLGQIPDQPGIYRTEKQFSPLCPFSDTGYIIQDPGNLGSTEISIRDQAGLLPDDFVKTVFFQFLDHIGGPAGTAIQWHCIPVSPVFLSQRIVVSR